MNSRTRPLLERRSLLRMRPADSAHAQIWARNRRKAIDTPATGKLLRRPDATWAGFFRCPKLTPISSGSVPTPLLFTSRPQRAFSKALRNLSADEKVARTGSASSRKRPNPDSTAQREDCTIPIVRMSSDRLFLGRLLASSARLRFTGTINLTRLFQRPTPNRTFLLCLDTG